LNAPGNVIGLEEGYVLVIFTAGVCLALGRCKIALEDHHAWSELT
jgi:hypothetical protein